MHCKEKFASIYNREPQDVAFCPYRICPLGAHIDHQNGIVTGLAIDKGINIAYSPKQNGVIELCSMQFDKRAQWHVKSVPDEKQNDWADYLRGATLNLSQKYMLKVGLCGVIEGELPIGGLSSSAAVIIAFLTALCRVNGITLTELEMIAMAQSAENKYVGVSCGKLDQSCEVFSKKGKLLYLDTKNGEFNLISTNPNMKPYKIAIFFSGVERVLTKSNYNLRVDECRACAYSLLAFNGDEYSLVSKTSLRDVPYEVYLKHKDKLPLKWQKRAEHYYSECNRVEKGVELWKNGDIKGFGKLIFESGFSSINNYETGSPELVELFTILTQTKGVYGARFSGAGYKGCCMALIDPEETANIKQEVEMRYLEKFPNLKGKYSAHICESADGVKL